MAGLGSHAHARARMVLGLIHDPNELADKLEADGDEFDGKTIREIIEGVPCARRLVVAAAIRNLGAQKRHWSKSKDDWVYEPDTNAQMKAVEFLANYSDGRPTETSLNVNVGGDEAGVEVDLEKALKTYPALRSRLAKMLGAPA